MRTQRSQIVNLDMMSEKLGVSKSVISRVLSGQAKKYRISDRTAVRIREEAKRSFYDLRKVPAARKRKSGIVGLLVPSLSDPYFSRLSGFVVSKLNEKGYLCTPMETLDNEETLRQGAVSMLSHGTEALIVVPCGKDNAFLEKVDSDIAPVVLLDHYYAETTLSYVTSDNFRGAVDAVNYLIDKGHRNIACIQGDSGILTGEERVKGYLHAMEKAGLSSFEKVVGGSEFSVEEGYRQTLALLGAGTPPTAIFTLSHALVVGAIDAAREKGLKIPEDITLMSFDNNIHTDYLIPHISQPMEDMALLVTQTIFNRLNGIRTGTTHIKLSPKLFRI